MHQINPTLDFRRRQLIILAILVIGIPLLVFTVQRVQELRQRAAGGAAASLTMPTIFTLQTTQEVDIPITLNTDGVGIRGVDVVLNFDQTKLHVVSIVANARDQAGSTLKTFAPVTTTGVFDSAKVIADANTNGRIEFGAVTYDWTAQAPTAAYNGTTTLATVRFRGLATGSVPVTFQFTPGSTTDTNIVSDVNPPVDLLTQASQLTNTTVTVVVSATPTPTTGLPTITPTHTPTRTPTPTQPVATNTPVPNSTNLSLTLKLHGLGNGGDTVNPNSQGNMTPLRTTRPVTVEMYSALNNQLVGTATGNVVYNSTTGVFTGTIQAPSAVTTTGYNLRVTSPGFLVALQLGVFVTQNQINTVPTIILITGDANNDKTLDILDYNILVSCYGAVGSTKPSTCTGNGHIDTDFFDDGNVNFIDLNLWLREFSKKS